MTTHAQANRCYRNDTYSKIRTSAIIAAQYPNGYSKNPWPAGSWEWRRWVLEFNRELQRLVNAEAERHEQQFAEQFNREAEVCRGGEGFLARLYRRFAGLIQGAK